MLKEELINDTFISILINLNMNSKWYINLTCKDNSYMSILAPCFMSYTFWFNHWFKVFNLKKQNCICGKKFNKKIYYLNHLNNCDTNKLCPERLLSNYFNSIEINKTIINYIYSIENKIDYLNKGKYEKINLNEFKIKIKKEKNININNKENLINLVSTDDEFFIRIIPNLCYDIGIEERNKNNINKILYKEN